MLDPRFDDERAREALGTREEPIADVLLDQAVFGGVGNIVKNEALWRARVPPTVPAASVPADDRERVFEEAVAFTRAWYERGGPYPVDGGTRIYRASACPRCGGDVTRRRVGEWDRITFWCPACQRLHDPPGRPATPPSRTDDGTVPV